MTILYMTKWSQLGWEGGWLGYPTSGETSYGPLGSKQEFQGAGLFWSQPTGVYAVGGAIRAKYDAVGGAGGYLGYPVSDENVLPGGVGRMNRFKNGVIYWHPSTGAHPVSGGILAQWAQQGYEAGPAGYPLEDQRQISPPGVTPVGFEQVFQGMVHASPRRIDDTYCGDICTDAIYRQFPQLRVVVPDLGASSFSRTSCPEPAAKSEAALCAADGAERRAPAIAAVFGPNSAIQDFCYSKGANNWYVEAHYACGYKEVNGVLKRIDTGAIVGTLSYTLEYEVRLDPTRLDNNTFRTNVIVTGATGKAANAKVSVEPQCAISECTFTPASREASIGPVGTNVQFDFNATMDEPLAAPGGFVSATNIDFDQFWTPGPGDYWISGTLGETQVPTIRCDNYDYLVRAGAGVGCVFAEAISAMDFGPEKNIPEIAWHTEQAQDSGLPGRGTPLHRATPSEAAASEAIACRGSRYPSPRPAGKECDEYPYKSAREGAQFAGAPRTINPPCGLKQIFEGLGPAGFSVCLLNDKQNNSQGSVINQFYNRYRIRYGDPYKVYASGGVAPVPAPGWDN